MQETLYLKRLLLENEKDILTFTTEIEQLEYNNQK
jgi:hypothetical protein